MFLLPNTSIAQKKCLYYNLALFRINFNPIMIKYTLIYKFIILIPSKVYLWKTIPWIFYQNRIHLFFPSLILS